MIIQLETGISDADAEQVRQSLQSFGFKPTDVKTQAHRYLVAPGSAEFDIRRIGHLHGVKDVHRVSDVYKLVSRKWKVGSSTVDLGDGVLVGGGSFAIMAGPCSVENEAQVDATAAFLKQHRIGVMRGGAFKPRTSPYAFRGLGLDGLKMFHSIAKSHGIKIISEVLAAGQIAEMYDFVDIYQVGARNSQNFNLLHELGKVDKPVLIKRGMSGTVEELLQSAEYVFANGNERLLLCERGIRTYEKAYRNTLDINAIPVLKEKSHLPVIVDPSHGIGIRKFVEPVALAGVIAGADGMLVEIHQQPEEALSDGDQTLNFEETAQLFKKTAQLLELRESW